MKIFIGLCGKVRNGFDSPSRGEGRWALNLVRCLKDYGHIIVCAPDMEECSWGQCEIPENVIMVQPYHKRLLYDKHFDVAIFTSWLTPREEARYINADKYLWGVIGWKSTVMVNGYFSDNDYVIRFGRNDLTNIPEDINFKDRQFLLSQPFGKEFGESKFDNKRIAWIAKESFLPETNSTLSAAAKRHLFATVDACKAAGCGLSIFNSHEFHPIRCPKVAEMGILEKIKELDDVTWHPSMTYSEYHKELSKCSVTVPFTFHGSSQEAVFMGLVPMLYKDSGFGEHVWTGTACQDLTKGKFSKLDHGKTDESTILTQDEIKDILVKLLTDKAFFNEYLHRFRPMALDNLDDHVVGQLNEIMKHKNERKVE